MRMERAIQNRERTRIVPIFFGVLFLLATPIVHGGETGVALPTAIHPERRDAASPAAGQTVPVNPPPLLWPVSSGTEVRYAVRLSQEPEFPAGSTIAADGLRWAFFNPHQKLADGTWYWKFSTVRRAGEEAKWSDVFRFEVDSSARVSVTPPAVEMIAAVPKSHPRILIAAEDLARLRAKLKGSEQAARAARSADRYVGQKLPGETQGQPSERGKNEFEAKNFAKWASKGYASQLLGQVRPLVAAYLMTGDARYGKEAARRAVFIAKLDPDGVTAPGVSDFADGSCMEAMALAYDSCFDLLADDEKARLREAMTARASRWFDRQINNLESRVFSAHVWQHILQQAAEIAFATVGEVPEADLWASYVYELWVAKFPLLGGDDGGWANGINYFGTNFKTLVDMPTLFERLTGVDFFDQPWYRNAIYYQIYAWPPGSASDGFGDGAERDGPPSTSRALFVDVLGRRFEDPAALWYVRQVAPERDLADSLSTMVALERVLVDDSSVPIEPALPRDLPQARAFRDIGLVAMHTNLAETPENLMIGFRSSPYGSFNHMHSDQNALNVNVGGKRLFCSSGYYIGYGDDHFKGWYTQTRGQNSVLIDGQGQVRGADGYGWIARYLHGRQITYATGDASAAYGDAGLTRFRRHLVFLRPATIVVYDELEADHPAEWNWLLHSKDKMTADAPHQRLHTARAQVDLLGSSRLAIAVDDQFDPPAINWRGKTDGGKVLEYPNQWHATAMPADRSKKARFLAVIQVRPADDTAAFQAPVHEENGLVRVGDWRIQAEMDSSRRASLEVQRADGQAALAVDVPSVTVGRKKYELDGLESVLIETNGGMLVRCKDELPAAARSATRQLATAGGGG